MKCEKCRTVLGPYTAKIETQFAAHDESKVDVSIICLECGSCLNAFIEQIDCAFYPEKR